MKRTHVRLLFLGWPEDFWATRGEVTAHSWTDTANLLGMAQEAPDIEPSGEVCELHSAVIRGSDDPCRSRVGWGGALIGQRGAFFTEEQAFDPVFMGGISAVRPASFSLSVTLQCKV
jgi:hypothetical protein